MGARLNRMDFFPGHSETQNGAGRRRFAVAPVRFYAVGEGYGFAAAPGVGDAVGRGRGLTGGHELEGPVPAPVFPQDDAAGDNRFAFRRVCGVFSEGEGFGADHKGRGRLGGLMIGVGGDGEADGAGPGAGQKVAGAAGRGGEAEHPQPAGAPQERGRKGIRRAAADFRRGAEGDDAPGVHHGEIIGHGQGFLLVVGNQDGGNPGVAEDAFDLAAQAHPEGGVQGTEGFVQEDDVRGDGQGPGQGDALAFTPGEGRGTPVGERGQFHQTQFLPGDFSGFPPVRPAHSWAERHVLLHAHMGEEGVVLEYHAHPAVLAFEVGDVPAALEDAPGGGAEKAGGQVEKGGFAAAAGAEDNGEFAFREGEIRVKGEVAPVKSEVPECKLTHD